MAPYFDGFWIHAKRQDGSASNSVADVQRVIAAAPGKPIIIADYSMSNPDSPLSVNPDNCDWGACFNTQGNRGSRMVSFWQQALHLQGSNGKYAVVGLE